MRFHWSLRITATCFVLICGMLTASRWQWRRHLEKLQIVNQLQHNLELPICSLEDLRGSMTADATSYVHRRVQISGSYDFEHEMVLRNRRHDTTPGVLLLTPLKLDGSSDWILVSRGFIPLTLASAQHRSAVRRPPHASFIGLIKEASPRRFLAPADPPAGDGNPWVDAWLRVDVASIQKQLPYSLQPFFVEVMQTDEPGQAQEKIVSSKSGRDEIFFLPGKPLVESAHSVDSDPTHYPIAMFDTIVPPARHLGYVYEWAAMAFVTLLIGLCLQLKRPTAASRLSRQSPVAPPATGKIPRGNAV